LEQVETDEDILQTFRMVQNPSKFRIWKKKKGPRPEFLNLSPLSTEAYGDAWPGMDPENPIVLPDMKR